MDKEQKKILYYFIIFVALGIMLTCGYIIYKEMRDAKTFCANVNGVYSSEKTFKFIPIQHLCNGEEIAKYKIRNDVFWEFERIRNFTLPLV